MPVPAESDTGLLPYMTFFLIPQRVRMEFSASIQNIDYLKKDYSSNIPSK